MVQFCEFFYYGEHVGDERGLDLKLEKVERGQVTARVGEALVLSVHLSEFVKGLQAGFAKFVI